MQQELKKIPMQMNGNKQESHKRKHGIAMLFTKQAVAIYSNEEQEVSLSDLIHKSIEDSHCQDPQPMTIHFLNGNQNEPGIKSYVDNYDIVAVVMANQTDGGVVNQVADKFSLWKLSIREAVTAYKHVCEQATFGASHYRA